MLERPTILLVEDPRVETAIEHLEEHRGSGALAANDE